MARLLIGLVLLPSSALTLFAAGRALAYLAARAPSAFPFLAGLLLAAAAWMLERYCLASDAGPAAWFGALARRTYVLGHELTHALAAWSFGGKVLGFNVGDSGGHVDLSHSNAFICLAPYCVPIYTLGVILGYRVLLWFRPGFGGSFGFLAVVGLTLAFHGFKTFEALWDSKQPDLRQAGGVVFSVSWIGLANGLVVLLLIKALFPEGVSLGRELRQVAERSAGFWLWLWHFLKPLTTGFASQLKRP